MDHPARRSGQIPSDLKCVWVRHADVAGGHVLQQHPDSINQAAATGIQGPVQGLGVGPGRICRGQGVHRLAHPEHHSAVRRGVVCRCLARGVHQPPAPCQVGFLHAIEPGTLGPGRVREPLVVDRRLLGRWCRQPEPAVGAVGAQPCGFGSEPPRFGPPHSRDWPTRRSASSRRPRRRRKDRRCCEGCRPGKGPDSQDSRRIPRGGGCLEVHS